MSTAVSNKEVSLPVNISTTGIFSLTRRLTPDETAFLTLGSMNKFKRALFGRKSTLVEDALRDSDSPENLLNLLSFVTYVGNTFIRLESKGSSTPEQVTSAIKGLEEMFSLPVFNRSSEPVKIAFGSATFRTGDKEFYKVSHNGETLEVQSGILTPVWNPPIVVDAKDCTQCG